MGYFISLEGPDGSGKSTQAQLLAHGLESNGYRVLLTREPGGTDIGDQIRSVLHDRRNTEMTARTEILLYSASRAQHVDQEIVPALEAGHIVVCDRYSDSTLAYQGYGRGLDLEALRWITDFATGGLVPDLTLCLDIAPELGLQRRKQANQEWNRLDAETLEFHRRTRVGYLELAAAAPERWVIIDASSPLPVVQLAVTTTVQAKIEEWLKRETGMQRSNS